MGSRIRRIDFLGVPGLGKSTLYNDLRAHRDAGQNWKTPAEAKTTIAQKESLRNVHSVGSYIVAFLLNIRLFKTLHPPLTDLVLKKYNRLMPWDTKEEEEALNLLIHTVAATPYPPALKAGRYEGLLETAREVTLFERYAPAGITLLFDMSLSQRMSNLGPWNTREDLRNLRTLSTLLGNLSAVVFLDAEESLVLERLEMRKRITGLVNKAHRDLNDYELAVYTEERLKSVRQFADMLEEEGVVVIRVNAGDPVATQVRFVKEKLSQFFPG